MSLYLGRGKETSLSLHDVERPGSESDLHLVPKLRMSGSVPLLPLICLHGVESETSAFYTKIFA